MDVEKAKEALRLVRTRETERKRVEGVIRGRERANRERATSELELLIDYLAAEGIEVDKPEGMAVVLAVMSEMTRGAEPTGKPETSIGDTPRLDWSDPELFQKAGW